jgi:hypothetical protein
MKKTQTHSKLPHKNQMAVKTLATDGSAGFLVGWMKRFGTTLNLFAFPLNKKEHPNL